jgi:drug/metabolite transporter (DMT)-like permease
MVGICTGLALEAGSNALTVVLIRTAGVVAIFLTYFHIAGLRLRIAPRDRNIAIALGVPLCVNNYSVSAAMEVIPVPLAVLIFYLWPAITTSISWVLGKDRFRWRSLAGLALAFAGIALALNVDFTAAQAKGVWLALLAAVTWSAVFLLTGHFFKGRDTRVPTLYMAATSGVFFLIACVVTGQFVLPSGVGGWMGLSGIAFFYAFGMIGLFAATVRLGPARTGFYMNFEPIAAVLLAALILRQTLAPIQLAGAALVILALFLFRPPPAAAQAESTKA